MCVTVICLLVVTIASRSLLPPLTLIVGRNLCISICDIHAPMDLAAQSMDPYSAQKSMDCAEICGSRRVQSTDLPRFFIPTLPSSHFYELILLDKQYVIGELFSKYQPGTKRMCLIIVILRQLHAVTPCTTLGLLRRRQSVIPSIVEVSGGCQSVNIYMCLRQRGIEMICILRKIHRLRKHPWISAQTDRQTDCAGRSMDCADPWIAQIHRLRPI